MIKIVLTNHFVSYPKREKWKESSSPYSSMRRIMNHIEFKSTGKLTRIITVAYPKNHLLRFPKYNIHNKSKHALPQGQEVNQVLESQ